MYCMFSMCVVVLFFRKVILFLTLNHFFLVFVCLIQIFYLTLPLL